MINSGINKPRRAASTVPPSLHIVGGGDRRDAAVPTANVFDNLSGVLTTRLRETAAQCPAAAQQVKVTVLDCAAALERMHTAISSGIVRLHQVENELRAVSLALARAQEELADTQVREMRARHLAMHDPLTALPNRRYFRQRLDLALSSANFPQQAVAVLYIDLNGFKSVNDAHGHHTGDQLLQIVAARLKNSMRAEDMVCRLGGDEFGCLLTGLPNRRQVSQVAAKVFDIISAPLRIGGLNIAAPPSIGIALAPGDGATSEDLLRRADAAMYHAKQYRAGHAFFREAFPKGMTPDAQCVGTHC